MQSSDSLFLYFFRLSIPTWANWLNRVIESWSLSGNNGSESVTTCKFIFFAPARQTRQIGATLFRCDLCLFCCARGFDIKIGLRQRIVLARYCANIDGLLLLLAFPTQWTFSAATRIFEIVFTHCCLIYICAIQTNLIHSFFRFFLTIDTFGGNSWRRNTAHELHVPRKGHGLLCRRRSRLSGLSHVRRARSTVQLPLPKCHSLPAANANLWSLVHGRLPVIGGKLRL